jgi:predicted O-methyltransferase YrrM
MSIARKANKLFRALAMVASHPALLNKILDDEDTYKKSFIEKSGMKKGLPELSFYALLPQNGVTIEPFALLDGGSLPSDLALIRILAERINAQTYFEIGTWRGESVMQAAAIIPKCYTLNLSETEMKQRNWDDAYIKMHRYFSKGNPHITHLEGDSRNFDFSPYYGKIDLVFVDGDHHRDSVKSDTEQAFKLVHPETGIIIWHDYAHHPENVRWNVLDGIYSGTPEGMRKDLRAVSNTLCALYAPGIHVQTQERSYPANPGSGFSIHLKAFSK